MTAFYRGVGRSPSRYMDELESSVANFSKLNFLVVMK